MQQESTPDILGFTADDLAKAVSYGRYKAQGSIKDDIFKCAIVGSEGIIGFGEYDVTEISKCDPFEWVAESMLGGYIAAHMEVRIAALSTVCNVNIDYLAEVIGLCQFEKPYTKEISNGLSISLDLTTNTLTILKSNGDTQDVLLTWVYPMKNHDDIANLHFACNYIRRMLTNRGVPFIRLNGFVNYEIATPEECAKGYSFESLTHTYNEEGEFVEGAYITATTVRRKTALDLLEDAETDIDYAMLKLVHAVLEGNSFDYVIDVYAEADAIARTYRVKISDWIKNQKEAINKYDYSFKPEASNIERVTDKEVFPLGDWDDLTNVLAAARFCRNQHYLYKDKEYSHD